MTRLPEPLSGTNPCGANKERLRHLKRRRSPERSARSNSGQTPSPGHSRHSVTSWQSGNCITTNAVPEWPPRCHRRLQPYGPGGDGTPILTDWTVILFKHQGWKEPVELHQVGIFLLSLKSLLETGKGASWPNEIKIDSWE
jgi:hypothetical protein